MLFDLRCPTDHLTYSNGILWEWPTNRRNEIHCRLIRNLGLTISSPTRAPHIRHTLQAHCVNVADLFRISPLAAAGQRRVLWTRIVVSISHNSLFNKGLLVINFHQTSSGTESHPKWVEVVCWCECLLYLCGGSSTEETTRHQKLIC